MTKVFTDVEVFLQACGQAHSNIPVDSNDLSDLYLKLIKEEQQEFWDAVVASDDVEIADACFDMIWVIVGYMKARGWDCDRMWDEGAASNLSKIDAKTGFVNRREDGKILKPADWQPPNFKKFVATPIKAVK